MKTTISGKAKGEITAPPSKSVAHRVILAAALSEGTSHIKNIEYSEDIKATLKAAESFGAKIEQNKDQVTITGTKNPKPINKTIDCNESGSTIRFLIPILAQTGEEITFTGKKRLMERPQQIYREIFQENNLKFHQTEEEIKIKGPLKSGTYTIRGDVSSQFITGLLYALPLAEKSSTIKIIPPFESKSYVNLTIQVLKQFGIKIKWVDNYTLEIQGNQQYKPQDVTVEGDWSNAAFPAVLGVLTQDIILKGLKKDTEQGDSAIIKILQQSGAKITEQNGTYQFQESQLKSSTIDLSDCPDLGPVLMTFAAFCQGTTTFINAGRLRIKESDRIEAIAQELEKFGITVEQIDKETVKITGKKLKQPDCEINSHNDHRIVMACTVGALSAGMKITIQNSQAVAKSWPSFFEQIEKIGAKIEHHEQ